MSRHTSSSLRLNFAQKQEKPVLLLPLIPICVFPQPLADFSHTISDSWKHFSTLACLSFNNRADFWQLAKIYSNVRQRVKRFRLPTPTSTSIPFHVIRPCPILFFSFSENCHKIFSLASFVCVFSYSHPSFRLREVNYNRSTTNSKLNLSLNQC